jgi:magnesium-transporting ATPase (P-type)
MAMLAAAFCGEWMIAFALIPPLVLSNGVDLYQMKQADDVNESLSWSAGLRAVVLREGQVLEIDAADLVPGDVVHISKVGKPHLLQPIC